MTRRAAVNFLLVILIFGAWMPTLIWIPRIEGFVFPVVTFDDSYGLTEGERFRFVLAGFKYRSCRLVSTDYSWRGSDGKSLGPAIVTDEAGKVYELPASRSSGEAFVSRPLYAAIPSMVAGSYRSIIFQVTLYYECHLGYPIEQTWRAAVTMPLDSPETQH